MTKSSKDKFVEDLAKELYIPENQIVERLKALGYTRFQKAKQFEYRKALLSDETIKQTIERERLKYRFNRKDYPEPGPCPVPGCGGKMIPLPVSERLFSPWMCSRKGLIHSTASVVATFRGRREGLTREEELAFMKTIADHLEKQRGKEKD